MFFRNSVILFLNIQDGITKSNLNRKLGYGSTYPYNSKIVDSFVRLGLVNKHIVGREKGLFLTQYGKELQNELKGACDVLERIEEVFVID